MNDLDLLRRYEPVVRYTKGEMFFPCAVDGYLQRCRLWRADADRTTTLLADQGTLTTTTIATHRTIPQNHRLYLQFVDEPLRALDYQRWLRRPNRQILEHPNRLYRVGLISRIMDALFDLALLLRGRVPGGTAAAAQQQYAGMQADDPRAVYYGRVVRSGGYIALQYIFFFAMNDWRSSFYGVNDHESDWEQIFVYLTDEGDAPPIPRWVAYASHDFSGDDLRRRWDDPELEKVDDIHPVIYAGAGSHASYFSRGEYLMQAEPRVLAPVHGVTAAIERFWRETLHQGTSFNLDAGIRALLSIPFVDYARGDGRTIGPGGQIEWTPVIIDDDGWVDGYRGLWGLDTWDPLGGERAPSGPKYERNGAVRLSWRNPLAWAGLDKVPPPREAVTAMDQLLTELETEKAALVPQIAAQRDVVRRLELEVESLRQTEFLTTLLRRRETERAAEEEALNALRDRYNDILESEKAGEDLLARMRQGDFGDPRAHIRHAHVPQPPIASVGTFARWWAAVSGGVILLIILALVYFRPAGWLLWLAGITVLFGGVEAAARRRLSGFLLGVTMLLALLNAAILLYRFWWLALVLGLTALAVVMIRDNLREVGRAR